MSLTYQRPLFDLYLTLNHSHLSAVTNHWHSFQTNLGMVLASPVTPGRPSCPHWLQLGGAVCPLRWSSAAAELLGPPGPCPPGGKSWRVKVPLSESAGKSAPFFIYSSKFYFFQIWLTGDFFLTVIKSFEDPHDLEIRISRVKKMDGRYEKLLNKKQLVSFLLQNQKKLTVFHLAGGAPA